jgi:7-cyano-7-deazaguanine synthase in queuosine biosynthesis
MNIQCSNLDDLLFDASPLSMRTAEEHAAQCPACAEKLESWNELSVTAQSLRTTWQNDLLWPRIERALRAEKKRSPMRRLWQVAAAALLTLGLGGTVLYTVREQVRDANFDKKIITLSAVEEAEKAEQAHIQAIAKLENLADAKLENSESPLMASYKEKLMLLDDAIAECQANIDRNRQNAHMREQLLAMYSEKQQTLVDVLREDTNVSNQ